MEIKQVGNRYYYYSRMQFRSFPIKKDEALAKIESGEAIKVDRWWYENVVGLEESKQVEPVAIETVTVEEITAEVEQANVIDFSKRKEQKQQDTEMEKAKSYFINEVLPHLSSDEMQKMLLDPKTFKETMSRALIRITVEKIK